jgi:hypothetical protein
MTIPAELTLALEPLIRLTRCVRYRRRVRRRVLTGLPYIHEPLATSRHGGQQVRELSRDVLESKAAVAEGTSMDWLGTEGLTSA